MELLIYVLHGAWHTEDTDGTGVLGVAEETGPLLGKLHGIADRKAEGYVELCGHVWEEHGERYYEAMDGDGRYARFCVVEEHLHISGRTLGRAILKKAAGRRMACRRCGSKVRREREAGLREEYPYYCPRCDENMYSFECMEMSLRERRRIQCRKWAAKIKKRGKRHERRADESGWIWKWKAAGNGQMDGG